MGIESKYYEPKVEENIDTEIEYLFIAQKKIENAKIPHRIYIPSYSRAIVNKGRHLKYIYIT